MASPITRRSALLGAGASLASLALACSSGGPPATERPRPPPPAANPFVDLEASSGGRVGVCVLDTGSGARLTHRADERFALCSTFKWALAAAVLARVNRGELALGERVSYSAADLLDHAPVTRARLAEGAMTVSELAEAAVTVSDNAAANLLLAKLDGPPGLTRFFRALGDSVTRLDRTEPTLNTNLPGDPRDTTTPAAMVGAMQAVLLSDALSPEGRERLLGWMKSCTTGLSRLRGGWPASWVAADKTGTGARGAVNDVALVWPTGRAPLLVAVYLSDSAEPLGRLEAAHVEAARRIARWSATDR